jgi:diacylglycerol kinase family enzyme
MTSRRGEATELTRDVAGQVDAIYVFGGDGTYNEVLNGADTETPLGFIPGGGASVLPRALGLPRDAVAAARQLAAGSTRRIGLGRVNGHRFGFASGVGLDAELVRAVDDLGRKPDGKRPGDFAFAWSGVRVLSRHGFSLDSALEVKGHGRAAFALVSNGPTYTYAGRLALRPAREATFEGGLDLVGPKKVRARRLARLLRHAVSGMDRAKPDDVVYVHDADRLEVVCDEALPLQADGEDLGDVDRAVFEAERDAVTVLV